jgi:sortase A
VVARLDIEKINAQLPVLAKTTEATLKVSVCHYKGAMPGEDGNMVVTGHNYANGAIFGKLDQVKAGESVLLTDRDGITQAYTIYRIDHIRPDEREALDDTAYARELTLMTCESHGNGRLIVRCRADT